MILEPGVATVTATQITFEGFTFKDVDFPTAQDEALDWLRARCAAEAP